MRPSLPVLFLFLGHFATGVAQNPKSGTLADLPPQLGFQEGKMNQVVDYAAAEGNSVPLYVVNATDAPKPFFVHYPPMFLFRETLGDDGQWRRCAPSSPGPWCGAGLERLGDKVEIPPAGFYQTYLPLNDDKGERRKIRYREYLQTDMANWTSTWTSNEGLGVVDPAKVEASRFDHIGVSHGPFEDVARVALKQVPVTSDRPELPWKIALIRLASSEKDPRRIDVLKQVITKAKEENDCNAYSLALAGLSKISPPEWTEEAYWKFAVVEIKSGQPLSSVALDRLMESNFFPERIRSLLDQIIANPRHPNLEIAIRKYSEIADTAGAKKVAQRVSRSSKYPETARIAAREILAKLQPTP